jgi:hypothetical protein
MLRVPIYPIKNLKCNNRNLHEYSPYVINENNENIIDETWWCSLTNYCKNKICQLTKFKLGKVAIPHEFQFDNGSKFLTIMYKCYIDSFDYNIWYDYIKNNDNMPQNVVLIPIDQNFKDTFVELYNSNEKYSNQLENFKNDIEVKMKHEQYFIRLSSTSGKNEKSVESFKSVDDIISHISSVKLFIDQEYIQKKESYLIMMPWNDYIDDRYEFRIFVVNYKLTAVSQQNFKKLYNYSCEELEIFEHALNNISFIKLTPYKTYVCDVYVNMETQTCHLIELNPFGAHSGAGSALFNWIDDYDILHGLRDTEFRYLSIINI